MRIASILENQKIEKRIAITPDIAKKYIAFGFEISLVEKYGEHLGFKDNDYKILGVNILNDESEMGHIELSRSADLIIVAPATANLMAKMALGIASDLPSTLLLATDTPILIAPAMNVRMWEHSATQNNFKTLINNGVHFVGPDEGDMACGEFGFGRMSEPDVIVNSASNILINGPLKIGRASCRERV